MTAVAISPPLVGVAAVEEEAVEKFSFDASFQTKIAAMAMRDQQFMQRVEGLIRPEYFENQSEAQLVSLMLRYYGKYKKIPGDITTYATLIREDVVNKVMSADSARAAAASLAPLWAQDISDRDFVVDQVATFARHQAVADAMGKSILKLDRKDFPAIEKLMKDALNVGANLDFNGYDYGAMSAARTQERKDRAAGLLKPTGITTGFAALDAHLMHKGWGRKELSCLLGPAKAGKSTALMEFGVAAAGAGYNVLNVTLELSAEIYAMRMDANISGFAVNELGLHPDEVKRLVDQFLDGTRPPPFPGAPVVKSGVFKLHEYPSGSMRVSDLKRLIERYKAQGIIFDLVVVDYADLMAPERFTDNVQENSKSVYVNLRGLAMEEGFAVLTATQTNRAGAGKAVITATDVADDFNKIRIADIVISLNRTEEERALKQARLYFAACRNQAGGFTIVVEQDLNRMKYITKVVGIE